MLALAGCAIQIGFDIDFGLVPLFSFLDSLK
jgi:hypothetical protein